MVKKALKIGVAIILFFVSFVLVWVFVKVDSKGGSWQVSGGHLQPPWLFRRKANPSF